MSAQAPAGWYPDGQGNERYWDGNTWTENLRAPVPNAPAATPTSPTEPGGVFARIGTSIMRSSTLKKQAREEARREHEERRTAAGALVTSGVFGLSTIELYEGGYVRIATPENESADVAEITASAPFERLVSIDYRDPDRPQVVEESPELVDGAIAQTLSTVLRAGRTAMKATAIGLASTAISTGLSQWKENRTHRSELIITTDREIHTLTNEISLSVLKISRKEHNAVGEALEDAGRRILGLPLERELEEAAAAAAAAAAAEAAAASAPPKLADRLRELAALHSEGILSDAEFTAAKAKLLGGL